MNKLRRLAAALLACITVAGNSICTCAENMFSSANSIEKSLLNNPVDAEWVKQAKQIADTFYTNPYGYFEYDELKRLIKKTEDAMANHNRDCKYSYNDLLKIHNAFENARVVRMREY